MKFVPVGLVAPITTSFFLASSMVRTPVVCQTTRTSSGRTGLPIQLNFAASYCVPLSPSACPMAMVCCTTAMTEPSCGPTL